MATEFREARMNLLATGRFLTIFPASSLRIPTRLHEIKVLPVELPKVRMPIGIFTLKNRTLSRVPRLFLDRVREIAKPLAKLGEIEAGMAPPGPSYRQATPGLISALGLEPALHACPLFVRLAARPVGRVHRLAVAMPVRDLH